MKIGRLLARAARVLLRRAVPQPAEAVADVLAIGIDAALDARRRSREARSTAASAGHDTRKANRLPDPIVTEKEAR